MPKLSQSAVIRAPVHDVYAAVADVERYPEFLPDVLRAKKTGNQVEMTVRAGPIELTWVHEATFVLERSIGLRLVRGPFKRLDGRWTFESRPGGTFVTYSTEWDLDLRLPGAAFLVSRALTANVESTLRAFRKRIEASG